MVDANDQTMFIRSVSKDSRAMNDVLGGFMTANPLYVKTVVRFIQGQKYGWVITYTSD